MGRDLHHGDRVDALKEGIAAAIRGEASAARRFLWRALRASPRELVAWQWLTKVAETREELALAGEEISALGGSAGDPKPFPPGDRRSRRQPLPSARGHCPLCALPWAERPRRCPRCGGLIDLDDPSAFLVPGESDTSQLRSAIALWTGRPGVDERERHRILALARLNLGELAEALAHARILVDLEPDDDVARRLCRELSEVLATMPRESGFETDEITRPSADDLDSVG